MIVEHEYPILEYSTEQSAVIDPRRSGRPFPRLCIMTFFREVLDGFIERCGGEVIGTYVSEMRPFPAYRAVCEGVEVCAIQAVVGCGSIAMMTDWLYGNGVEVLLCCGGCGVLAPIPAGEVLLPVRALRDEGASYKYLPPSRYIELDEAPIRQFRQVMELRRVPYLECTTWSTDGFYRETREMVAHRVRQGCTAVEMECATMAAIARFRQKTFGQLLYSGDILTGSDEYDDRDWRSKPSARQLLFEITLEALRGL